MIFCVLSRTYGIFKVFRSLFLVLYTFSIRLCVLSSFTRHWYMYAYTNTPVAVAVYRWTNTSPQMQSALACTCMCLCCGCVQTTTFACNRHTFAMLPIVLCGYWCFGDRMLYLCMCMYVHILSSLAWVLWLDICLYGAKAMCCAHISECKSAWCMFLSSHSAVLVFG